MKSLDFTMPLFSYRLWNKELMFLWKNAEVRILSEVFAKKYAEVLKKLDIKIIVPVPPRPGKILEKGWDQINEVCNILKFKYGFRLFNILERKSRLQQKKLDRNQRLEVIESAYSVVSANQFSRVLKKYRNSLPEKVCIIDDVCTTGSTLECCAKLLKETGIKTVFAVTLFAVD